MSPEIYNAYVKLLHEELVPAMGCTEPIAIAYASALARDTLGIEAAVAAGVVAGNANKALEVISEVSDAQKAQIQEMVAKKLCKVSLLDSGLVLDLIVTLYAGNDWARVRIINSHTNVVLVEKNGEILQEKPVDTTSSIGEISPEKQLLTIHDIVEFARTVNLDDVREVLTRQINYNTAICEEGLRNNAARQRRPLAPTPEWAAASCRW